MLTFLGWNGFLTMNFFSMALQSFRPWRLFEFLNLHTVGRTPWTGYQPVARPIPTHRTTQTQNKRTQTSMPRVGLEPTFQVFELANTVHVQTAEIVCSSSTQGMVVCLRLFCVYVLYVGSGFAMDWSPAQGVLPTVYRLSNWKSGQGPKGCRAIESEREI
jgi:hypothetical protein